MSPVTVRATLAPLLVLLLTVGSPRSSAAADPSDHSIPDAQVAASAPADSILWETLEGALNASRQDGRPILVYFTFDT